jgi:hypothetical protein
MDQSREEIQRAEEQKKLDERKRFLAELTTSAYDKAKTFMAVIGTAGYAGLFAIWGWVSHDLARWERLFIALFLGLSLLIFVVWQLYGAFVIARQQALFGQIVSAPDTDLDSAMNDFRVENTRIEGMLASLWEPVLWALAVPGILGALVLVFACARHLLFEFPK